MRSNANGEAHGGVVLQKYMVAKTLAKVENQILSS